MITREWPADSGLRHDGAVFHFDRALLGSLDSAAWTAFVLAWLFAVMVAAAFAVVRHSDCLAEIFGEPYGTLILTLAITVIEVMMIAAVMLTGPQVSTLARDTHVRGGDDRLQRHGGPVAAGGGGLRYHEQTYNLQGASSFLSP